MADLVFAQSKSSARSNGLACFQECEAPFEPDGIAAPHEARPPAIVQRQLVHHCRPEGIEPQCVWRIGE